MKIRIRLVSVLLAGAILAGLSGCATRVEAADLMDGITPEPVVKEMGDDAFQAGIADFSVKLLQNVREKGKNSLISPVSALAALSMTTNGADGETLAQMKKTLCGNEEISMEEFNSAMAAFLDGLKQESDEGSKVRLANSIWVRDDDQLQVQTPFLQTNGNYYGADVYQSAFDSRGAGDVNTWVSQNTDGMIDRIVDEIRPETMMLLINALVFDGQWQEQYEEYQVEDGEFHLTDGTNQPAKMMNSREGLYLKDQNATGFIKSYQGGKYGFFALLPQEGMTVDAYLDTLTGAGLYEMLKNPEQADVDIKLPKFKTDYENTLVPALKAMGINDAFSSQADFSKMASYGGDSLFIGNVIQKTYFELDENGTKAAAATAVEMRNDSAFIPDPNPYQVILDRPFVYGIVDRDSGLPLFIGTMHQLGE